jgi:hypothetical protein
MCFHLSAKPGGIFSGGKRIRLSREWHRAIFLLRNDWLSFPIGALLW